MGKRTCGTTQPEKDYIKNYAKTWVIKSFRDKATQPEKDEIDAKINAKKTRETATKFPEEDQIIEEIALWDELKEEKEDEEASIKVAGKAVVEEGAELEMEPRTVVKCGSFTAEKDSTITIKSGSKLTVAREDDETDDEITDSIEEDAAEEEAKTTETAATKEVKEFLVKEGAIINTEADTEINIERPFKVDGDAEIQGKIVVNKDIVKSIEDEKVVVEGEEKTNVGLQKSDATGKGIFTLSNGGELSGSGTVSAKTIKIISGSKLSPGNSPGALDIDGDVELDAESVVSVEIVNSDNYDLLHVSGTIRLGGKLQVSEGDSCLQPVKIFKSEEGIESEFSSINGAAADTSGSKSADGYDYTLGCSACQANQYVVKTSGSNMGTCTPCAQGATNTRGDVPWGTATTCDVPIVKCAKGEHVAQGSCVTCSPGTSRDQEDVISGGDTACTVEYCLINQHVKNNACVACPGGTERGAGDPTDGDDTTCTATAQCSETQHSVDNVCVDCAAGKTSINADTSQTNAESVCIATLCAVDQHVQNNVCVNCASQTTNEKGDDASGGPTECGKVVCALNTHVTDTATTAVCTGCAEGYFNDVQDELSGGDTSCKSTDAYCTINQKVVSNTCVNCATGTEQTPKLLKSSADSTCTTVTCKIDEYVSSNVCTPCAAGTSIAKDGDASKTDTACAPTICDYDKYVSSNVCTQCPTGTSIAAGGDASKFDTTCVVDICEKDERVVSNSCQKCPEGEFNAAGNTADSDDTECSPQTCEINEYVVNNRCTACDPGKTNDAGAKTNTDLKSECTATMCELDEYVLNNVCTTCATGTVNTIVTDASKSNIQANNVCAEPKGFSVQGVLEMMNINVEAAKNAEALIKKHIIAMYGVAGKKVTIDSILAPVARRLLSTSFTRVPSRRLGADVEVKYTVTGFADQKTADEAKVAFDAKVTKGDFVTALRNEDKSTFGDAKVYPQGKAAPAVVEAEIIDDKLSSGSSVTFATATIAVFAAVLGFVM